MTFGATLTPAPSPALVAPRFQTTISYHDRDTKALHIADKYCSILTESVLDVGCDRARLRGLLGPSVRYTGVDIAPGHADLVLNLDAEDLPFAPKGQHTVVCTDVLEHLERCHAVLDQLCTIAGRYVIVSLPNPVRDMLLHLAERATGPIKHYGLPLSPPPDRHRWFFDSAEAEALVRHAAAKHSLNVAQIDFEPGGLPCWLKGGGPNVLAAPHLTRGTMWAVLERSA